MTTRSAQTTDATLMAFGQRVAGLRRERGWSQVDLAKRVGCSQKAISMWEDGERCPGGDYLAILAGVFGVTMEFIWSGR